MPVEEPPVNPVVEQPHSGGSATPIQPPADGGAAGAAPTVEGGASAAPAANADEERAARLAKLPDVLREAFADDLDDAELDEIGAGLTVEKLKALPPEIRASVRAILKRDAAVTADRVKADAEAATKAEAAQQKLVEDRKALRRREAALMALAQSPAAQDPGAPPQVDPFTAEGAAKLTEFHARKGLADTFAPLREEGRKASERAYWDSLCDEHPDLLDQKVATEFGEYVAKMNEGIDPEKIRAGLERPRLTAGDAASLFFSKRKVAALSAEVASAKDRQDADRAEAARAIGRESGGGTPDLLAAYDRLRKQDEDAAYELLERNPEVKRAVFARNGVREMRT